MVGLYGRRHLQRFARADDVVHREHRVVDIKIGVAWEVARKKRPLGRRDVQVPASCLGACGVPAMLYVQFACSADRRVRACAGLRVFVLGWEDLRRAGALATATACP